MTRYPDKTGSGDNTLETLRKSKANLASALRIAGLGSYEWNIVQDILTWSDETYKIFGHDRDTYTPSTTGFFNQIHPDDCAMVKRANHAALHGGTYDVVFRITRTDGDERVLHEQAEVDLNSKGKPVAMRGAIYDVTEKTKNEEKILKLNQELELRVEERTRELSEAQDELIRKDRLATLGKLTATVSHELRNPLGAMRPALYLLAKHLSKSGDEKLHQALDRLDRNIDRCDQIVDELLDFARSTTLELSLTRIDDWLDKLIDEQGISTEIKLEKKYSLQKLESFIDQNRFHRAVTNTIDNACQAICEGQNSDRPKSGNRLTILTRIQNQGFEIQITDNGPGMSKEVLSNIFEPLYSTKSFGVGLGMPTIKEIMRLHNGDVQVQSGEGKGTTVTLWMPFNMESSK